GRRLPLRHALPQPSSASMVIPPPKSVPRQANLVALAKMLRIDPRALQYGDPDGRNIREPGKAWKVTAADQLAIDAFLALPSAQRKAIRDLIATLARAQATAA
ncbi:MAG TPA: hypothetical protein PK818_06275, partial [Thermomonas sp.]|nr:hypothetical protein [Thermomonas sp.]